MASTTESTAAASLAAQFAEYAERCDQLPGEWLTDGASYDIGAAIYSAWLHDLLGSEPAIKNAVGILANNPPPAETRED